MGSVFHPFKAALVYVSKATLIGSELGSIFVSCMYITCTLEIRTFQLVMLHDLVNIIPGRNGRRHPMGIQYGNIFISPTGEMQSRRAAPGTRTDYENR